MKSNDYREFYQQLNNLAEGLISEEDFKKLEHQIENDPEALEIYVNFMFLWRDLRYFQAATEPDCLTCECLEESPPKKYSEADLCELLVLETASPAIPIIEETPEASTLPPKKPDNTPKKTDRRSFYFASSAVAALLLIFLAVVYQTYFASYEVATLVDSMNAVCRNREDLATGCRLYNRVAPLELTEGIIAIEFDNGAQVIIESPTTFECLEPNMVKIYNGRMNAVIFDDAYGFTVITPTSTIIDLGTEFGVEVDQAGTTKAHMFEGQAVVSSCGQDQPHKRFLLSQGQSKQVDVDGRIHDINHEQTSLIRRINSQRNVIWRGETSLDLGDIIGGGNGLGTGQLSGGRLDAGGTINPITGRINDPTRTHMLEVNPTYYDDVVGDFEFSSNYVTVPQLTYVDGIFVPDSSQGPCIVSSTEHIFADCPDTSARMKWNITNGWRFRKDPYGAKNNADMATRRGFTLHANLGITFDLQAIRTAMPSVEFVAFSSRAGLPITEEPNLSCVDVFVLLDGRKEFAKTNLRAYEEIDIHVPIDPQTRFLTLISTDGVAQQNTEPFEYKRYYNDWTFFTDAVLHVQPIKTPKKESIAGLN